MARKLIDGQDRLNFTLALMSYLAEARDNVDKVTVADLMERFDVTQKDLSKALSTLSVAGFTKVWSGDEKIHFYFTAPVNDDDDDPEYHLESQVDFDFDIEANLSEAPRLSSSQVAALIAGLQYLASLPELGIAGRINALIEKLAAGHQGQIVTDIEYRPGTVGASMVLLRKAIVEQKRIRCDYTNQHLESSTRELDPVRIDPRASNSQLRAWCHNNNAGRNFRIDHIRNIEILETDWCEQAKELQTTDEADYISKETDIEVIVEVDPEAYGLVGDFNGEVISVDKKTLVRRARLKIGFLPYFGRQVSRYGGAARIIEPDSAKLLVREFALAALETQANRKD